MMEMEFDNCKIGVEGMMAEHKWHKQQATRKNGQILDQWHIVNNIEILCIVLKSTETGKQIWVMMWVEMISKNILVDI